MIAGQKLPVDLMCVDTDYQTGITYNYDYVNDNMRQVGGTTVNDAVSSATTYIPMVRHWVLSARLVLQRLGE
ncbi:hypothetical protein HMF3257_38085 [Spirosoma telluris]|uniref:Uncharacterized protein n=1 Tax=Spirosoma telluris TaxID=2183553 RepID=A0A327ND98_9BACT|nr:hypothetical protein HMF3257_38085 [Spirosoma telluris]